MVRECESNSHTCDVIVGIRDNGEIVTCSNSGKVYVNGSHYCGIHTRDTWEEMADV